ncbi:MAG: ATP-binding protein [Hyphomicrobiales bacterium]|nr:MAG: ATP-binding protein [Hyphomicrobiales bacterium]
MALVKEEIIKKWKDLLEDNSQGVIDGAERMAVTAQLLENTEKMIASGESGVLTEAAPATNTGGISNYDPVLISLIRRAAPKLIAYDILGVQPMTGPTGQVFAMRSKYVNQSGAEAFYNEANTGFSGITGGNTSILGDASLNVGTAPSGNTQAYNFGGAMSLVQAEALGTSGNAAFAEMSFSIENFAITAGSRALKAEYTHEMAQDLKAIHGMEAEKELSDILSTELISDINREIVRSVYICAVEGAQTGTTTAGVYDLDTDSNGRWMGEKFAGLHFFLETEAHVIAKQTRRGRGNIIITSSNVASALRMAGTLKFNEAANKLNIDDTGVTFAGTLSGGTKVYIDPYAAADFCVIGYKGANALDAGMFYCPYTPLQKVRAVDSDAFTPKIGYKTRYAMAANPFSKGSAVSNGALEANSNVYYRRVNISNII